MLPGLVNFASKDLLEIGVELLIGRDQQAGPADLSQSKDIRVIRAQLWQFCFLLLNIFWEKYFEFSVLSVYLKTLSHFLVLL